MKASIRTFKMEKLIQGRSPVEVFKFFSDEKNLEKITPPWLNFKVVGMSTDKIEKGTRIQYRLKVHGIPMGWETLIEEWSPEERFVDVQLKGPYALWHHTHSFKPVDGGVLMVDEIKYQVPFGILGDLVAGKFITADVEKIFKYRNEQISKHFGLNAAESTGETAGEEK